MADKNLIEVLGGWEGYTLGTVGRIEPGAGRGAGGEVWIELHPIWDRRRRCSGCGRVVETIHDIRERWIRDLPILDADTWLLIHRVRVACPRCGPKVEALDWLDRYARVTRRLADNVARLCKVLPIKQAAEYFALDWKTVKAIDKSHLERALGSVDVGGVTVIALPFQNTTSTAISSISHFATSPIWSLPISYCS